MLAFVEILPHNYNILMALNKQQYSSYKKEQRNLTIELQLHQLVDRSSNLHIRVFKCTYYYYHRRRNYYVVNRG